MPASAPSPTTSQRAASSAPPAGVLPPAGGITCPSPQKTPTTRREILVALGEDARGPEQPRRAQRITEPDVSPLDSGFVVVIIPTFMFKAKAVSALVWAVSMVLLVAVLTPAAEIIPSGPNTAPHVAPASDEGERAIKRFRVPKGFKVELFAAEPLLANPVCFSIDEKGRFYVAETFRL